MNKLWIPTLMRWLRVPPEPNPPGGAPGSVRVFRSGRNALRLSLTIWGAKQVMALVGLLFGLAMLSEFRMLRNAGNSPGSPPASNSWISRAIVQKLAPKFSLDRLAQRTPEPVFWMLYLAEAVSILTYLIQIPLTYALRRLEYDQRWYIVTDRSLRLRNGVWKLREVTMSFANLQQISISQNPLQRFLGLADVRVQSAGGGAPVHPNHSGEEPTSHLGCFHAVDNAEEIRNLILERLRRFRESGLGDPDEPVTEHSYAPSGTSAADLTSAARELLTEARSLRASIQGCRAGK